MIIGHKSPCFSPRLLLPSPQYHTRCLSDLLITWQNLISYYFNHQTKTVLCMLHECLLSFFKQFSNSFSQAAWPFFPPFVLLTTTKNNTIKELEEGNSCSTKQCLKIPEKSLVFSDLKFPSYIFFSMSKSNIKKKERKEKETFLWCLCFKTLWGRTITTAFLLTANFVYPKLLVTLSFRLI